MTTVETTRHVAADPASVALLLATPHGSEQGVDGDGLRLVSRRSSALARVSAPRRSGVGFAADVSVEIADQAPARGTVTVVPAADPGCDVRLVVDGLEVSHARTVARWAGQFLDSLVVQARSRAFAA